jgi:hypothetical protein
MKQPHLGRVPKEEGLARLGYRYLAVEDYEGSTIFVHRILRGARDYLRFF